MGLVEMRAELIVPNSLTSAEQARARRRATNVMLPESLLRKARELNVDMPQACERGLSAAVSEAKAQQWLRENRAAMDAWNNRVEQHGLSLAEFRQF